MKAAPFEYRRAGSVEEACALLAEDPEARLLAGGQTLIPMLAMRLARPTRLIDILRVPGLDAIARADGQIRLGATARQAAVERSALVAEELPLLARALPWVGHAPTRRRGTIGGSIANADPSAEIGLVAVTLDAEVLVAGGPAEAIPAGAFFLSAMVTALPAGAMVTGLRFPRRTERARTGFGFQEISARRSDYALAAAAALLRLDAEGNCAEIALGIGGMGEVPVRVRLEGLLGRAPEPEVLRMAVEAALAPLPALEDARTSGAYRRRAAAALACRALAEAAEGARRDAWANAPTGEVKRWN
ncbi:FAD binding domain-containing protein [Roseomonas sp. E05]|uniref:FAD binding domain-containing protein n=1 Tax=Roseomonas sp. E05 TaxID=3046310 RepID=UPI0024B8CC7D|nr:FAD binding domain-containing protein [Roseomonas sp. E05]MDJ0391115.1 FAD binding domain-containing protein [Roseomonas sp. E05]